MISLGVWRGETAIGALTRTRAGVRFVYEPDVLERAGLGRSVVSFVLAEDGAVTLAPLYDVFCTVAYPQRSVVPGMFIAGVRDIRSIGRDDLVTEAASWGIHADRAGVIVGELCEGAREAMTQAIAEFDDTPRSLVDMLRRRVDEFVQS
jgi:hypothetical protein